MPFSRKSKRSRNVAGRDNAPASTDKVAVLCLPCHEQQSTSNPASEPRKPQNGYLPKTTAGTVATAATATSSRSLYSVASTLVERDLCPVTGVYADIHGDYYVHPEIIGKGHYGVVRQCTHIATRQTFAVKSVDKAKIGRLDHLQREIFLLANVDHPSIMKMVDCYEDGMQVHIITEKYTGGELFDKIVSSTDGSGCFSEKRAAGVIKSVLEAVAYLHDNGVVHRDIKPENIMFENAYDESSVRLIDFGLSRRHDLRSEGYMRNAVGTAYYMAPELLKGKYDRSCDLWAVGVVTYILLAGYPPFNGGNDAEIQESTRRNKLQFRGTQWLSRSDDAMDFVRCLLRRDPRKRFTAQEALCHPWIARATSS